MTATPSVSRRKYYRTVPGSPTEPTSTLVLTSPRNHYVDVRVFNEPQTKTTSDPKTFDGRLQWAFAGIKESVQDKGRTISTWHHWVDSLSETPASDSGEMIELEDGDVLEKGETRDEETGVVQKYEELWEEVPLGTIGEGSGRVCVVLRTEDEEGQEREGMVIRIGGIVQGVLRDRMGVTVERWEWVYGERSGRFERTVRFGEGELPCGGLLKSDLVEEGERYLEATIILTGGHRHLNANPALLLSSLCSLVSSRDDCDQAWSAGQPLCPARKKEPPGSVSQPPTTNLQSDATTYRAYETGHNLLSSPFAIMASIKFIPHQMGPVTQYSTRALRSGPLWLLIKDAGILLTVLPYLPLLFFPRNTAAYDDREKGTSKFKSRRDSAIQCLLCLLEALLLVLFIPALISLPTILFIAAALLSILLLGLIAWPAQGPRILHSAESNTATPTADQHPHERWLFINGICTGSSGLQANIDRLSLLFGRQVLGIHNQSFGLLSDLLECLLQRCLSYHTMDMRVACEIMKDFLEDEKVEKVVLVAHSQGGIIASMAVDALVTELSGNAMGKLEIYTFGSAASHFHNPPSASTTDTTSSSSTNLQGDIIPHIEHYANEYDMVPRWGVLYAISNLLSNRYAGSVFVRAGATGHMFVEHYLDPIFPLAGPKKFKPNVNVQQKYATENGHTAYGRIEKALSCLDTLVDVDEAVLLKRLSSAPVKPLVQMKTRQNPGTAKSQGTPAIHGDGPLISHEMVNGRRTQEERVISEQKARGKTMRELSRLWLYLEGSSPKERRL
ncbi:MAG: hypothetical protein Q9186_005810 [Xanthomendoza sp. 1 TL-2023]